jgi:multidrug efflux pump subunit AcrA (membrane-fusion protein)
MRYFMQSSTGSTASRLATLLLLAFAVTFTACGKKNATVRPEYKPLVETVYASGSVVPDREYKVFALADGVITRRLVNEGDSVKAGQAILTIDNEEQAARDAAARNIFQTAQSNLSSDSPALQEAAARLQSAQAKLRVDSSNYARSKELFESRSATQAELDRATLALQTAQNDVSAAQKALQRLRNQLFVELQNAQSQYRVAAKQDANFTARSWIDGMIYEMYKQEGEAVRRNDPLALVGDAGNVYLRLSVDELDIQKIRAGQEVLVKMDLYGDRTFKARVSKIYPMLTKQDQSFRVDATFSEPLPARFAGVSVEANIIVSRKDRALVIPKTLLLAGDSVEVQSASGSQRVKIRKGAETFEFVEIVGGLDEKSELVKK